MIPVYNGEATIERCLESLAAQTKRPHEIVLVDNGSTDGTVAKMRQFADAHRDMSVVLLSETKRGPAPARNRGLREVTGDTVAFTDADAYAREDWLEKLGSLYASGNWDGIGGYYRFRNPKGITAKLQALDMAIPERFTGKEIKEMHLCLYGQLLGTCNASYRKSVLDRLGGFDDELSLTGEDMDLSLRAVAAGFRLLSWHPDVVIWHEPRKSLWQFWARIFEYRTVLARIVKKYFRGQALVHRPGFGVARRKFPVTMMITQEFYLLIAAVIAVAVCWRFRLLVPAFFAAAVVTMFRFGLDLRKRSDALGLEILPAQIPALVFADMMKKIFSEAGRIYGSLKHRVLVI